MLELAREIRAAADARSRFRCIERLAREWHGVEPIGYEPREVHVATRRLGVRLPAAVRQWYESFARTEGIALAQNFAIPPRDWRLSEHRLSVCIENQGNWRALVDLDGDDPPVFVVEHIAVGRLSESFSLWALQNALFESVMATGRPNGPVSQDAARWLESRFGPPVIEPWAAIGHGPGPIDFYLGQPGLAFHEKTARREWLFLSLVDDDAVLADVECSAPVLEWVVAPTEL